MTDTAEQMALTERYRESLSRSLGEATVEADGRLQPLTGDQARTA